jgi:hypothetical protein
MKSLIYKYPILKAKYEALNQYGRCVTRRLITKRNSDIGEGGDWDLLDFYKEYEYSTGHGKVSTYIDTGFPDSQGKYNQGYLHVPYNFTEQETIYRVYSKLQAGEVVYWRESFCKEKECDIPCYGLKDSNLNCYANRSPYSMSEKLARTFVRIVDVRPEIFNFNEFVKFNGFNDYFLEGGIEAVPFLKKYEGLWLWRIEQEKVK